MKTYSRPIRLASTGAAIAQSAISRATTLSSLLVTPNKYDVKVKLRDGGSTAQVIWEVEADNGAGSHFENFSSPLRFKYGIYVEADPDQASGGNFAVCLGVDEPMA